MATKKAAKAVAKVAIQMPKELTVTQTSSVTKVTIESPLNIKVDVTLYPDGGIDDVYVSAIDGKRPKVICDSGLSDAISNAADYSDEEFEAIVSIIKAVRAAIKENKK